MNQKIHNTINSKSQRFKLYCLSFLSGVTTASLLDLRESKGLIFLVAIILGFLFLTQKIYVTFSVWLMLTFLLGIVRHSFVFPVSDIGRIESYADQKITITGFVSTEPDVRIDSIHYVMNTRTVETRAGPQTVTGNIAVKADRYPRLTYGDQVKITCQLKKPEPMVDQENGKVFRYDLALARQTIFALCQNPVVTQIGFGEGNPIMFQILYFKNKLAARLEQLWPEPYASFMAGLLYGYRGGLGPLNDLFSKTGVAHIVAVSGFNISVIANILLTSCYWVLIKRRQAFWVVATAIFVFVIFTGASASVVRAGIMGFIVLLAKQVGRGSQISSVLVLTATLMTLHNPLVLIYDAGFQLSFLATLGLVYGNPLLEPYLQWIPSTFGLRENTISTTAATLATLPLILYQFGRLAVLTIAVNLLVLWVIPLLMAVGFAALLASMVHNYLGLGLAWIGWLGMWYVIRVVTWFGTIDWAAPEVSFSGFWLIVSYLGYGSILFSKKYRYGAHNY